MKSHGKKVKEMSRQVVKHKARSDGNDQYWTCDISSWSHLSIYLRSWLIFSLLYTRYKPAKLRPHSASRPHGILIRLATNTLIAKDDEEGGTREKGLYYKLHEFSKHSQTWKERPEYASMILNACVILWDFWDLALSDAMQSPCAVWKNWFSQSGFLRCLLKLRIEQLEEKPLHAAYVAYVAYWETNPSIHRSQVLHAVPVWCCVFWCIWLSTQDSRHCFERKFDDVYLCFIKTGWRVARLSIVNGNAQWLNDKSLWFLVVILTLPKFYWCWRQLEANRCVAKNLVNSSANPIQRRQVLIAERKKALFRLSSDLFGPGLACVSSSKIYGVDLCLKLLQIAASRMTVLRI